MEFISSFFTATFVSTLIGNILSNRTDSLLCHTTKQIYKRLKDNIQSPANHDIQKAVRISYLKATWITCDSFKRRKYNLTDRIHSKAPGNIDDIKKYIRKEVKRLSELSFQPPLSDFENEYSLLLQPQNTTCIERIPKMVLQLKESLFSELERVGLYAELDLKDAILNGWEEDEPATFDWTVN